MALSATPQYLYHQWPDGQAPPLRFTPRTLSTTALARQLIPHYDLPSPYFTSCFSTSPKHNLGTAPRPFVWDSVNQDYFCYEPETTCYIYARLGRIHYDAVKKEHYRPDALQRLTFATTYPKHRVYSSGELMFWDSRRQDWYQYDMQRRRILWRDQRWWPFPQRFEPPSLNSPPRSPVSSAPSSSGDCPNSPVYHALPIETRKECAQAVKPRIVEVSPFDASTVVRDAPGCSLLDDPVKRELIFERRRPKKKPIDTKMLIIPDDKNVVYEIPLHDRGHKSHKKRRGGIYDLQDLVDKTLRKKKRYSWF